MRDPHIRAASCKEALDDPGWYIPHPCRKDCGSATARYRGRSDLCEQTHKESFPTRAVTDLFLPVLCSSRCDMVLAHLKLKLKLL